jgi:glycosyltransferase involved in cell wall biosynthesis
MRIGFDAKRAFCNFRGLGNYSRSLVSSLVKYFPDNDYLLFTPKVKKEYNYFLVNEPRVTRHFPAGFPFQQVHPLWRSFKMANDVRSNKVDIFHGLSHEIPKGLSGQKVRTVVTIHDLMYIHFPEFFPWIDRVVYDQKIKYACKNADSVIAICEQTKNDLIEFYKVSPDKVTVQYQAIDERYFGGDHSDYPLSKETLQKGYILGVGAFVPNKNFESLIKAFGRMHKFLTQDLILVGFGSPQTLNEYNEIAKEYGCEKRVQYLSNVTAEQLPSLYKRASLFVLPSFHEGFGLPIIEAMSQGCPVVTTGGGAHQESAADCAVFINPNSVESISEGMLQVLENKEKFQVLSDSGRDRAHFFHPKIISQQLFRHYEIVTAKR